MNISSASYTRARGLLFLTLKAKKAMKSISVRPFCAGSRKLLHQLASSAFPGEVENLPR